MPASRRARTGQVPSNAERTTEPIDQSEQLKVVMELRKQAEKQSQIWRAVFTVFALSVGGIALFCLTSHLIRPGAMEHQQALSGVISSSHLYVVYLFMALGSGQAAFSCWDQHTSRRRRKERFILAAVLSSVPAVLLGLPLLLQGISHPFLHFLATGAFLVSGLCVWVDTDCDRIRGEVEHLSKLQYNYKTA